MSSKLFSRVYNTVELNKISMVLNKQPNNLSSNKLPNIITLQVLSCVSYL